MATDRIALLAEVGKAAAGGDVDFLRTAVKTMAEALMELEVAAQLGADPHERTLERTGYRNGHRSRDWDTRVGTIDLAIPRTRAGSYFPGWLLEPRRSHLAARWQRRQRGPRDRSKPAVASHG